MFYLAYLRSELLRRKGRTIVTVLGLATGVALVIVIAALSRGLQRAQDTALDPLASIGTDITVTLAPQQDDGLGPGGRGGSREVIQANQSVITDLSKLGKPGDKFVHDFFLPGTQLTFEAGQAKEVAAIEGVSAVAGGLLLTGVHQAGTVPKIVAEIQAGGQQLQVEREIPRPTEAEFAAMQACLKKAGIQIGPPGEDQQGGGRLGGGGQGEAGGGRAAFGACLPERLRRFRATITTPQETLRQVVDPPQTDITSSTYSIGGVDLSKPDIAIVTPSQVTSGRFLEGGDEALLSASYASRQKLKVGSTLELNGSKLEVVGLVRPPLGGQTADVYLPLSRLQALAGQKGLVNVVLVRAQSGADVADVQRRIEETFPSAEVASAQQVADRITGSLVDAADLSRRLGFALAALAAITAFLIAALLTFSSVGKRTRELGSLKALGWTQRLVVRQVVGESLAQGLLGGVLGLAIGVAAAALIGAVGPTLTASSSIGGGDDFFGLGSVTARTVTDEVTLVAPVAATVVLGGLAVALVGGLLAGAAGGVRAARLRPADALRQVD